MPNAYDQYLQSQYAPPKDQKGQPRKPTASDEYLESQLLQLLQPGEQVLHVAYMRRQPGLLMQILVGPLLLFFFMTKAYFAVLTNRRLLLIQTKASFWSFNGGPKPMNLGVEQYDARAIQKVTVGGIGNNRSMTFHMANGPKQKLRISPWFKTISGTKDFFKNVPELVTSGRLAQLAQLAAGSTAAPLQMGPPGFGSGFALGSRVLVAAPNGHRYPATVVQAGNGQYLCSMQDGQQYWFPFSAVGPG
ncbi:MAG: hypothetical protein FWD73_03230 [Polyangiaceae bacterium]|nr:hypothetical protein [Polyangiaceae bacterium]